MIDHVNEATGKVLPRGAKPTPRHLLAAAMPFRKVVAPSSFFIFPRKLSMWYNDTYGCCVTTEEAFNKACNGIYIDDATVLKWAGDRDLLNGANLEPVIQQMQADGFHQDQNVYGDGTGLSVNYADLATLQSAIYQAGQQGGCIKFALAANQLPAGAGNKNGWFLMSDSLDTNWDHCMGACGFGTVQEFVNAMNAAFPDLGLTVPAGVDPTIQGIATFTWSTIGFTAFPAFVNFCGEAWIRSPSSVNSGHGTPSPDSVYITGGPVPPPPPPPVCPPGQHPDPVTGVCVPDGPPPSPPPPSMGQVVIPDKVIQVPGLFTIHNVTIPGGTYPVVQKRPGF